MNASGKLIPDFRLISGGLILIFCLFASRAQSQPVVKASIDTTVIRIGEQFRLHLSATAPAEDKITFPLIGDSIRELDVVQRSAIDTTRSQDGKQSTLHQSFTLTGFDSGFFVIEPFTFFIQQKGGTSADSFSTEALLMQVQTIPVDTTKEIKDIKPPIDVPFTFREALPFILGGILLAALAWFLFRWFKNRKRKPEEILKKIPQRPAHEIAIEALEKIREQKLWQQGFYKEYHSGVSDTIRAYIENRFSVTALEMPSDDTLSHFRNKLITPAAYEKLSSILLLADIVKFAKGIPVGSENELSMQQAFDFIALTRPVTKDDLQSSEQDEKKEVSS